MILHNLCTIRLAALGETEILVYLIGLEDNVIPALVTRSALFDRAIAQIPSLNFLASFTTEDKVIEQSSSAVGLTTL